MDMFDRLRSGATPPWQRDPDCEYTAPGSETEAVDCWADAKWRHYDKDGRIVGLFCDAHSTPAQPGTDREYREYIVSNKVKALFATGKES